MIRTAAPIVHRLTVVDGGTVVATAADPLVCSHQPRKVVSYTSLGIEVEPGEQIPGTAGQKHCMSLCSTKSFIANPTA